MLWILMYYKDFHTFKFFFAFTKFRAFNFFYLKHATNCKQAERDTICTFPPTMSLAEQKRQSSTQHRLAYFQWPRIASAWLAILHSFNFTRCSRLTSTRCMRGVSIWKNKPRLLTTNNLNSAQDWKLEEKMWVSVSCNLGPQSWKWRCDLPMIVVTDMIFSRIELIQWIFFVMYSNTLCRNTTT